MNPFLSLPAHSHFFSAPELESESVCMENLEQNRTFVLSHLLPNVLLHLPDSKLVHSCRLVSKSWRDESTSILRRRKTAECTFEFHPPRGKFLYKKKKKRKSGRVVIETEAEKMNRKTLAELTDLLSCPHQTFPCSWFSFLTGSLNHPESLAFFSLHGEKVKRLAVNIVHNPIQKSCFLTRGIFKLTPNLEILGFFGPELLKYSRYNFPKEAEPPQNQNQNQNALNAQEGEKKEEMKFPLLPWLHLLCWESEVKTHNFEMAALSSVFNLIRSDPIAPQLSTLFIHTLRLTSQGPAQRRWHENPNPNPNDGLSLLKTLNSTFNLKFKMLILNIFHPQAFPSALLEAVSKFNLQTERLQLENFQCDDFVLLTENDRPSKDHFHGVRRALWRIMESTAGVLDYLKLSFQSFNLITRIPFPPGIFQKLSAISIVDPTAKENFNLSPRDYFHCGSSPQFASSASLAGALTDDLDGSDLDFPRDPLWTDLTSVAPYLKIFTIIDFLGPKPPLNVEEWLPFLNQCVAVTQENINPTEGDPDPTPEAPEQVTHNSSVQVLEIFGGGRTPTPQLLGQFIKSFPNLRTLILHLVQAPAFLPIMDPTHVSTLEELLSFLFGMEKPGKIQSKILEEEENDSKSESCWSSSQAEKEAGAQKLMSVSPENPREMLALALADDPIVKSIRTLLNLKNLMELRVSFSVCQLVEKSGQEPTKKLVSTSTSTSSASTAPANNSSCFLSRIPNTWHLGFSSDLQTFILKIFCYHHNFY